MRQFPRVLALLLLLAAGMLTAACGSNDGGDGTPPDGLSGNTLRKSETGEGVSGAFLVEGAFDVRVEGGGVTPDNSRLRVYRLTPEGAGYITKLVATTAPKASSDEIQIRPGSQIDVRFNLGPGEYYVLVDTAPQNAWTMIVTGVSGVPQG
jgi:hypothetical protein